MAFTQLTAVKIAKSSFLTLLGMIATYSFAAVLGAFIPANPRWSEPLDGVTIYVATNGYHTGILLPVSAQGADLSLLFRPTDLPDPDTAGNYLLFGWGDREFYLETPTWADLKPTTASTALMGSGSTLLHVDHVRSPDDVFEARPLRMSPEEYALLIAEIKRFVRTGNDGYPEALRGYGAQDVFYPSSGTYSLFQTCNVWTSDRLAAAGVKVGLWTPFSGGVMRWFQPE
jgi:uncharacterized protein (TIGR02117 family)